MNHKRLSKIENGALTEEQKQIMSDFDRTVERKNWRYERRVLSVGTSIDLENFVNLGKPPGKR